jgi:hypothetical protein
MTVRQKGNKWVLVSSSGKTLGVHPSKKAAQRQERAVKASQARSNR